jgi:hypothetical protein
MEKGKKRQPWRRFAKPACFFLVVFLLLAFSKFTVPYRETPAGAVALPNEARDKVTIVTIAGMLQVSYDQNLGEDTANVQTAQTVETWNMSNGEVYMQPLQTESLGCENKYLSSLGVSIETSNQLAYEEWGTVNVSVLDSAGSLLYASQLLVLDFKPGAATSGAANFSITTTDDNPVFLVKVAFPTQQDLNSANATMAQVPLFEYLLMKLGIAVP